MRTESGDAQVDVLSSRERRDFLQRTAIVIGAFFSGVVGVERARADGSSHRKACCTLAKPHDDTCHSKEHSACRGWILYWECDHGGDTYWCVECYEVGARAPGEHCRYKRNVDCSRAVPPDERDDLASPPRRNVPEPPPPPETPEQNPGCGGDDTTVGVSANARIGNDGDDGGGSTGIPGSPEPGDDPCDPVEPAASETTH